MTLIEGVVATVPLLLMVVVEVAEGVTRGVVVPMTTVVLLQVVAVMEVMVAKLVLAINSRPLGQAEVVGKMTATMVGESSAIN